MAHIRQHAIWLSGEVVSSIMTLSRTLERRPGSTGFLFTTVIMAFCMRIVPVLHLEGAPSLSSWDTF